MSSLDTFRLLGFNVRRFTSTSGSSTAKSVASLLDTHLVDLVCLNEVQLERFEELKASACSSYEWKFFGHVKGKYGNAIGSKFPITSTTEVRLRGGSEVQFPAGTRKMDGGIVQQGQIHKISRGMVMCEIDLDAGRRSKPLQSYNLNHSSEDPSTKQTTGVDDDDNDDDVHTKKKRFTSSNKITVACTHLDHISLEQRLIQLQHVAEEVSAIATPTLIVGDLNTLRRQDYTDEHWGQLEARAQSKGWGPPQSGGLEILECNGAQSKNTNVEADNDDNSSNYTDNNNTNNDDNGDNDDNNNNNNDSNNATTTTTTNTKPFVDCFSTAHKQSELRFTTPIDTPMYRIDYCFADSDVSQMFRVSHARVLDDVCFSDHFPVLFEFESKTKSLTKTSPIPCKV